MKLSSFTPVDQGCRQPWEGVLLWRPAVPADGYMTKVLGISNYRMPIRGASTSVSPGNTMKVAIMMQGMWDTNFWAFLTSQQL